MNLVNGLRMKELRELKGWDRKALADHAGIDPSVISRLERGIQADTRLSVIVAVARVLDVPLHTLLSDEVNQVSGEIAPELEAAVNQFSKQPRKIQRQAAAILRGFWGALEE